MNAAYPVIVNSDVAIENGASDADDADVADTAEPWFIENSAGSGPYVLESFTQGDALTMTANPNYWGEAPKSPTVVWRWSKEPAQRLHQSVGTQEEKTADEVRCPDDGGATGNRQVPPR
jgi:peptide/nickel transport system substrate-binding protein